MLGTFFQWIARLFGLKKNRPQGRHARWPTREGIELLPVFDGLGTENISVVDSPSEARLAHQDLMAAEVVGFDTESKPTFRKGEVSKGPHVAQFSTLRRAYVFLLHDRECRKLAADLISSSALKKVGFGLSGDLRQIRAKMGVEPREVFDLETLFVERGYGRGVGLKVGVAIALKRRIFKSKKATTSNWAYRRLTEKQILYAANDAYAPLTVFYALTKKTSTP